MADRPSIWFVSPAFRRYDVTRLALAQRAHLRGELAGRGLDAYGVVVADDENLDIAEEYGFETVEQSNEHLGRKFNDGIEFALRAGADYVCVIGSDDWAHPDLFDRLPADVMPEPDEPVDDEPVLWRDAPEIISGTRIAIADLRYGRLRTCTARGKLGVIPWVLPRIAFASCAGRPVREDQARGIDANLVRGLHLRPSVVLVDPSPYARIDWKSDVNLNSYDLVTGAIGDDPETTNPWPVLAQYYPAALVDEARAIHRGYREILL